MSEFVKVWEVVRVFPRYALYQKMILIFGLPLVIYYLYLVTAGRPPLVVYILDARFLRTAPLTPEKNILITLNVANLSKPGAEIHNITGEFWTRREFIVEQTHQPARQIDDSVYYDFEIPLLYKNTSSSVFEWVFKPPEVGKEIPLAYRIVASEVDWQTGSWSVVNDGTHISLKKNRKK
jgi:hypothetical protein